MYPTVEASSGESGTKFGPVDLSSDVHHLPKVEASTGQQWS